MNLSREALSWAAGFFDGEGHVRCGSYSLSISIEQSKGPELLEKFNRSVGNLGQLKGPYQATTSPTRNPHWRLNIHGFEKIQAILAMLWPWLGRVKKEQFKLAVATWNERPLKLNKARGNYGRV